MAYRIGLDAGHYVGDGRVPSAYRSILGTSDEYTLNLRTFNVVSSVLNGAGYEVVDIGRQQKSVVDRAKLAKQLKCHAVISLHHNASGGTGISTFRHSNGVMGTESLNLQNALYEYLKIVNAGDRSKPIASSELGVVNCSNTGCPSILIECAFMDNMTDVNKINSSSYNSDIAQAILSGLNKYFSIQSKPSTPSTSVTVKNVYNPWAYAKVQKVPSGDVLNVRSQANADSSIIRTLSNGNEVDVIETYTNGWAKINIVGTVGYVNATYLAINPVTQQTSVNTYSSWVGKVYNVGASGLNVRTGPGILYKKLAAYPKLGEGNLVAVIGESGNWYKIKIANKYEGYVSKSYLKRA